MGQLFSASPFSLSSVYLHVGQVEAPTPCLVRPRVSRAARLGRLHQPRLQPRRPLALSPPPPELPTGSPASSEEGGGGASHSSPLFFPLVFPPFLLPSSPSALLARQETMVGGQIRVGTASSTRTAAGSARPVAGSMLYQRFPGGPWWCPGGDGDGEYGCRPWLRAQRWLVRAFFTVLKVL